jgi:NTE family protein
MVESAPDGTDGSRGGNRPPFECIALLLQGGGALGSYQAGVYEALAEAGIHPEWVAGISIGAINSALIAGNPPGRRVERLRAFWEAISDSPFNTPPSFRVLPVTDDYHRAINQIRAFEVLLFGTPHFFKPRIPHPMLLPSSPVDAVSHYDTAPLRATLLELVDFDLLNSGSTRLSVGAVNVKTGNFVSFDNTTQKIGPEHIMASGSLPPGFPATEVDGEYFWDGGLVSNTPLQWVFDERPRRDTLAFQVDLWSARGELPRNLIDAEVRQKEIQFSSRTRAGTNHVKRAQRLRQAFTNVVRQLPPEMRDLEDVKLLQEEADDKIFNIVHLIYRSAGYEGMAKDYEFSRRTMEEHWRAGYEDAARALGHPEVLQPADRERGGVSTFDFGIDENGAEKFIIETGFRPL